MNTELAKIVDQVLLCGLDIKDRLDKGEQLDFSLMQSQLRALLKSEMEARKWPDYGGDAQVSGTTIGGQRPHSFLGIRYALACWLDELFIVGSRWSDQWKEQALEPELYQARERADRFWEQARRAEARPNSDALEAYFLCSMLGFRGKYASAPDKLRDWCDSVEPRLTKRYDKGFEVPPPKQPPCNVPPRYGRDRLRTVILIGALLAAVLLVLLPIAVFNLN